MKTISTENRLCECCMEVHDVRKVQVRETTIFKDVAVEFDAEYYYCDHAQETYEDENLMSLNDISMKNAYRRKAGLLTTDEIIAIRAKYGISQSDLCLLLGWGGKTIARYEGHQVQDNAHDTILRKLSVDPEWFLVLLKSSKEQLSSSSYRKYLRTGMSLFEQDHDLYLKYAIQSRYARFSENPEFTGGQKLSLDTVVDMICYFANSPQVLSLYKVKLMKMLWYSDALSFKRRNHSISGLAYQALPMGAVPVGHDSIIDLSGVRYEETEIGDGTAYKFIPNLRTEYPNLTEEDKIIMDAVIRRFGKATKDEIVYAMHKEDAYKETAPRDIIQFKYAKTLSLI